MAGRETASGKAEHERFEDGEIQFEVRGRGLEVLLTGSFVPD